MLDKSSTVRAQEHPTLERKLLDNLKVELEDIIHKVPKGTYITYADICHLIKSLKIQRMSVEGSLEAGILNYISSRFDLIKSSFLKKSLTKPGGRKLHDNENQKTSPFYFLELQANLIKKNDPAYNKVHSKIQDTPTIPEQDNDARTKRDYTLFENKKENAEKTIVHLPPVKPSFWKSKTKGRRLQEDAKPTLTTPQQDRAKIAEIYENRMRKNPGS